MLNRTRPLRVAVLCSGRAPGLLHVLNRDPRRGVSCDVVCCLTTEGRFAEQVGVERRAIPCIPRPIARYCAAHGAERTDLAVRAGYDAASPDGVLLEAI